MRHKQTRLWFNDDGGWSWNINEATHFMSRANLIEACARYKLNGVEIVMKFNGSQSDVTMDVSAPG